MAEEVKTGVNEPLAMSSTVQLALIMAEPDNTPPYFDSERSVIWGGGEATRSVIYPTLDLDIWFSKVITIMFRPPYRLVIASGDNCFNITY